MNVSKAKLKELAQKAWESDNPAMVDIKKRIIEAELANLTLEK